MTVSNHLASKYVKTIAVKMEVYCNLLNRWEPVTYLWLFDLWYFKWANFKTNIRLLSVSIFYLRRDTDVLSFPLLMSASFVLIVFEFYIHEPNMMDFLLREMTDLIVLAISDAKRIRRCITMHSPWLPPEIIT